MSIASINIGVPTNSGTSNINVSGKPIFILGRNGTGKSALVHYIRGQLQSHYFGRLVYLPGSRPSYFDGDSLNMNANSRLQFENNSSAWDASPDVRIRPVSGTTRNERAIFDLQAAELQYHVDAANDIKEKGRRSSAISKLQARTSPLDRVNRLLLQANLPVSTTISAGEIKAQRDGQTYSISRMSDGERTALILIADIISAKPGSCLLIDEPELHLHRSIVVPLMSALLVERPDCAMIVSTHELSLPNENAGCEIILVRGCLWSGGTPSAWDFDIISNAEDIPNDVRVDLLGSRRKILFVEGVSNSLDQPLYALLFPKISVRQRETCNEVRRAVSGLRQVQAYHHVEAYGIVDNDSMDVEFQKKLLSDDVYALPMFSVESIYYSKEVLEVVAKRQAKTFNLKPDDMLSKSILKALETLKKPGKAEHLAARVSERRMRDVFLKNIPTREKLISIGAEKMTVSLPSSYPGILENLKSLIASGDIHSIVKAYPVRESGILNDFAKNLHFIGEQDYEKAALTAINATEGLRKAIKVKLGKLAEHLA